MPDKFTPAISDEDDDSESEGGITKVGESEGEEQPGDEDGESEGDEEEEESEEAGEEEY